MRPIYIILLTLAGTALVGAAGLFWFIHSGISANDEPSALETTMASWVRNAAVSSAAGDAKNPLSPTPERLIDGSKHFADMCAECHANNGSGKPTIAAHMYPRSPDLRAAVTQKLSDAELFYIIKNGIRMSGMPAWPAHGDEDNWELVLFIRHLPKLTPQEEQTMEKYNPAPAEEHEHSGDHH